MSKVFAKQLQIAIEKKELHKSVIATDFISKFGVATKNAKIKTASTEVKECANALLKKGVKMEEGFRQYLYDLVGIKAETPAVQPKTTKRCDGEW